MKKIIVGIMAAFGTLVAWTSMAGAQALDGVESQVTGAKTELSGFVTGTAVPVLFSLLILGVGISLAVKYVRRGARAA